MANLFQKYKNSPVSGIDLSKLKKFLDSNGPYIALLQPGLLPQGATVPEMVMQCKAAIDELFAKYIKYKELGYVRDELQLMALGQLTNNSKTIRDYVIARSWKGMPVAEKTGRLTKTKFVQILNDWFTNHRDRIGWETVSPKPIVLSDPNDKQKKINYYLSDNYHKPINQAYYPYDFRNNPKLGKINLSVAQSEIILVSIVDRFKNDNDMVYFASDRKDESDAYTVITVLSGYPTHYSKTFKGAKNEFIKAVASIAEARERNKNARLKKARDEMTESELILRTQQIDNENAEYLRKIQKLQDQEREILIKKKVLIEESKLMK